MTGQDAEIEFIRHGVSCAALLERLSPAWRLDRKESTRRALKYRRGEGEVLIVNHDERGWWDPHSSAKGDVFDLAQYLDASLNFGQVRQVLRRFVGVTPIFPEILPASRQDKTGRSPHERWEVRPRVRRGSPAWNYLAESRRLPAWVLVAAVEVDVLREGFHGSAWFAHRDVGPVTHVEVRGPDFKGSLRGGAKALFRLPGRGGGAKNRLAVTEAPIDALSLAAIEDLRPDTLYVATGGGMGPRTVQAIERLLASAASFPAAEMASATDANPAGEHYAARHAELATTGGIAFARLTPTMGADWNDVLKGGDYNQTCLGAAEIWPAAGSTGPRSVRLD